jgi:YHS domain-containing protein
MRVLQTLIIVATLGWAGAAQAGGQYVDETGFAVSGHDVVAYFELEQAPVGQAQPKAVPGRKDITAEYNGATWAFATEANREKFVANPEKYLPVYDGHCAYGVAKGGKVPANPHLWRIVDGQLYLNITENVVGFWEEDIAGNIERAQSNWPGLADNPASERTIPMFSSEAPIAG